MPAVWDRNDYGMSAGTLRIISLMRWAMVLLILLVLCAAQAHDDDWTIAGTVIGGAMLAITAIIAIGPYWVATARGPSSAQADMLNQIASVSDERRRQIQALVDQDELTFARAKRICRENVSLRDEAERRRRESARGPQMNCDTTNGDPLVVQALGQGVSFIPCIDGWYRLLNQNERLHRMLCAGAAGPDAGLYWIVDHRQGVWGIPASFAGQVQQRLDAMGRTAERS